MSLQASSHSLVCRNVKYTNVHLLSIYLFLFTFAGLFHFLPIPRSMPLYVVVGTPIEIVQCDNPSEQSVNELHCAYFDEVRRIFERHKKAAGYHNSNLIYV